MKALLLTVEDGISPDIWLVHARAYLERGRPVLAITEQSNEWDAVGTGDDLPCYGPRLTAHADFTNRKVVPDDTSALISEIKRLPTNAVVMWNMSVFEWAVRDARWMDVLEVCVASPCDVVFMHYAYSSWWGGHFGREEELVKTVRWDYVAGNRICHSANREAVSKLLPHLMEALDQIRMVESSPYTGRWEVVSTCGSMVTTGPWRELPQRAEVLRSLACCGDMRTPYTDKLTKLASLR